jgi:hypothetical protein
MTSNVNAWTIPETGVRAPDLMFVVRPIAASGWDASHERNRKVCNALREQFRVGVVLVAPHAIGDYGWIRGSQWPVFPEIMT